MGQGRGKVSFDQDGNVIEEHVYESADADELVDVEGPTTDENVEKNIEDIEIPDLDIGFVVGTQPDGNLYFKPLGANSNLVSLIGLAQVAKDHIEYMANSQRMRPIDNAVIQGLQQVIQMQQQTIKFVQQVTAMLAGNKLNK